jgi:class 3 adenylate cyclase
MFRYWSCSVACLPQKSVISEIAKADCLFSVAFFQDARCFQMNDSPARRWFSRLIVLIPVGVLLFALFNQTQTFPKPKATKGSIDLSTWNFTQGGNVPLNGEWKFDWQSFQSSADSGSADYIQVPGIWNGHENGNARLPGEGHATYALNVKLPLRNCVYALNVLTVSNAYSLSVNDVPVASNGTFGSDASASRPEYRPQIVTFYADTDVVTIRMIVSNYHHCKGGMWLPVEIGFPQQVQHARDTRVLLEMFLFGCLFIMSLYHFGLYVLRTKDLTALFFGLMCAVIGVRSLLTGEVLINYIVPDLNWFLARKIEYILTFTSPAIYVAFCRKLFPSEWNLWMYRAIEFFGLGLCLFVLFTPTSVFTNTSYVFTGYAWIVGMVTIGVFIKALRKKLEGAGIFLATTLFFLLTIVNDTLNQMELVHTGLYLTFGLLVVTFAQSFSLSSRFSSAFFAAETYASTFRKFVPAQFLTRIAKDGIHSIKPGNAERAEVTVLFSDIRGFTSIAENSPPDEVFRMLNKYLSYVEPPITANNGFIDKYMGDGIMALFEKSETTRSAKFAIDAALQMQAGLESYNQHRIEDGKEPLAMGIGLHIGQVIIGTLGANDRMDSTAIGDAVNLASRIEGMTKMYGVPILASIDTLNALEDRSVYRARFVDNVMAKGKQEPIQIWQVIGNSTEDVSQNYFAMLLAYNDGIRFYRERNIVLAKERFERALKLEPSDRVSEIYLERCVRYLATDDEQHIADIAKLEMK